MNHEKKKRKMFHYKTVYHFSNLIISSIFCTFKEKKDGF